MPSFPLLCFLCELETVHNMLTWHVMPSVLTLRMCRLLSWCMSSRKKTKNEMKKKNTVYSFWQHLANELNSVIIGALHPSLPLASNYPLYKGDRTKQRGAYIHPDGRRSFRKRSAVIHYFLHRSAPFEWKEAGEWRPDCQIFSPTFDLLGCRTLIHLCSAGRPSDVGACGSHLAAPHLT